MMGLGCGGHSGLGLRAGGDDDNAIAVARRAFELGVNLVDTAEGYGTEEHIGKAIKGLPRGELVLATKLSFKHKEEWKDETRIRASVEGSLRKLGTDYIDVYQLHGRRMGDYERALDETYAVLVKLKEEGKIRFIGVSEMFGGDSKHEMLSRAVADGVWDTVMVGFNLFNTSARERVLKATREKGIGTFCMFPVRQALTAPAKLVQYLEKCFKEGALKRDDFDMEKPMGFLTADGVAASLAEAAYRFCRHEQGLDSILIGTGSTEHLEEDAKAIAMPPLPDRVLSKLEELFGGRDDLTGDIGWD